MSTKMREPSPSLCQGGTCQEKRKEEIRATGRDLGREERPDHRGDCLCLGTLGKVSQTRDKSEVGFEGRGESGSWPGRGGKSAP